MSRVALGLVLALLLVTSLVLSAPARLMALLLPSGQVFMQGFSGTVWRGSAGRCLVRTEAGLLHLGAVTWRLSPLSLLTLSPRLELDSRWGRQRVGGEVVLRGDRDFDLHGFEATVSADLVRQFAPVTLGGSLNASFGRLLLRGGLPVAGAGRLVWQDGSWLSPTGQLSLGSYAVEVAEAGEGVLRGEVLTLSGPVAASGEIELSGPAYSVDITVGGGRALDPRIEQALALVATPGENGFRLQLEGELL